MLVSAPAAAQAGDGGQDQGWQDEVHLRPESVEALLTVDRGGDRSESPTGSPTPEIDTGVFRTVTVAHGPAGGECQDERAVRVTMTGTRADGSEQTLVSQCEVSVVGSDDVRVRTSCRERRGTARASDGRLRSPRRRGLVGLRTGPHVGMPDQRLVSAAIQGYDLRVVAAADRGGGEPRRRQAAGAAVSCRGRARRCRWPVRVPTSRPSPPHGASDVGGRVGTRRPTGSAVRSGTISVVPGPTISSDYPVVQAQARLR